ncbi:hypothetical protein O0I10_003192 [Lichtheimia ornata]|uniref:Rab-GAP TBC domain-containing protein n=1 Tax=Lichtheimia ornata TaxID=688661 RepID=A0AAD7V8Q3_9FUNG|nr:uncharacterized protein O0I10_003192 [Lichtheimia ornata]KAJ8660970.1 hypothetical protein O0I10_003192 [Lichtheimia ornata]
MAERGAGWCHIAFTLCQIPAMQEYAAPQRSFWRRHGLRFPGRVKIVSRRTQEDTRSHGAGSNAARFQYTTLVIQETRHREAVTSPPEYASSPTKSSSPSKSSSKVLQNMPSPPSQKQRSSSSPHKSFDAFLKDTNDEWSDELGYDMVDKAKPLSTSPTSSKAMDHLQQQQQQHHQQEKQPQDPNDSLSTDTSNVSKPNIETLLQDPTHLVYCTDPERTKDPAKTKKFKDILAEPNVDLAALKKVSWSGIPKELRPVAWQLLLGYLPCNMARRAETLARKRKEYVDSVTASYAKGVAGLDQTLWHQIHIDIPRTNPGVPLYQYEATQLCLERILYQWAIRHPASGYVQGINDLVTPIFEVFLSAYIDENPEGYNVSKLDPEVLNVIEADSFWCLSKLLDGIQDNYTFAQPGIQRQVAILKDLATRIDSRLTTHLQDEGVEFIQFAFRWMNCLLMRELPLRCTVRMWDTYLAEGSSEGFSEFHVYVCAAFLVKWSSQLRSQDFQGIMLFLQQLPTQNWQAKDVELLLSEAYMWKTLFHNAPSHLK